MIKIYEGHTEDGYMGSTKWVGDKSQQHLYGKDLSAAIRQDLKENGFSGFTVRCRNLDNIIVTLKETNAVKISFEDFKNENWHYYASNWVEINGKGMSRNDFINSCTREQYNEYVRSLYDDWVINRKEFHNCDGKGFDECVFTKDFCQKLQKLDAVLKEYQYDDSNAMVDYFNTNMYYSVDVIIQ